jgi:CheY-like chemotaxis protein
MNLATRGVVDSVMPMPSVLVIDDQPELCRTIKAMLEKSGYQVSTAANGREAAGLIAGNTFDLVLTDVIMPQRDGLQVIMDVRKTNPELPVIVMTGVGDVQGDYYLQLAADLGARGILHKPFSGQELLNLVAQALPPSR